MQTFNETYRGCTISYSPEQQGFKVLWNSKVVHIAQSYSGACAWVDWQVRKSQPVLQLVQS